MNTKKNIAEETYETFLTTITGEDNSVNRMRGKTIDEIADLLKFTNPVLNLIPDRKLTTQLTTLYGLIINDRKMPAPSYPAHSQYDQKVNFIAECIDEEKYIDEITEFVINIYRINNNNTNVVTEIGKLLKKTNLDAEFWGLIDKGYSLNDILDLIFDYEGESNFKQANRLILLKHCFDQRNDKKEFIISEDKAKKKLDDLLIFAQKETSNEVFALLETLSVPERYKNLLTSLIIEKDSAFVNSLPKKLLKLAINSFNKENSNEFANNFEFLSVIMQHGTKTQKGDVVSILSEKLNKNADIDKVLDLIETTKDVPAFDPNGVLLSHLGKYQDDNKDSISKTVNEKIEQLKNKILNKT